MPIYDDNPTRPTAPTIAASAALELFWITFRCDETCAPGNQPIFGRSDAERTKLARRTQAFWEQRDAGFPELIVIASRRGMLPGTNLDAFLEDLPLAALRTDDLTLASETPAVREMIIRRLDRLASDARLRRRYLALLRDLWAAVRVDWETEGLPAVERAVAAASRRLAAGGNPAELAPSVSEPALALVRQADRGNLLVAPGYFAGRCVWELPGTLLLGFPAVSAGQAAELRARAELLVQPLKALADPTRLAIVLRLARSAASITEVTNEFAISQPAVSAHFRVLRESDLVTGVREGNRTLYRVDATRAAGVVEELATSLGLATGKRDQD